MLTPILPFINDTEDNISGILNMCIEARVYGVICFGMGLTLREGNREYFYEQLDRLFPDLKEKYIHTYGNQYMIESSNNKNLMRLFIENAKKMELCMIMSRYLTICVSLKKRTIAGN